MTAGITGGFQYPAVPVIGPGVPEPTAPAAALLGLALTALRRRRAG